MVYDISQADSNKEKQQDMSKVISSFTMSLDGFIADADDSITRLFKWYRSGDTEFPLPGTNMVFKMSRASAQLFGALIENTGALVTGRRDFDVSEAWQGKPPFNAPTFIVTHSPPQQWVYEGSPFIFVTDGVESAVLQAKLAAGEKNVVVGGSQIVRQCLRAGLLDEITIDLASMLLGSGISLFGELGVDPIELERVEIIEGTDVTHIRFRIVK